MASVDMPNKRRKLDLTETYTVVVGAGDAQKAFNIHKSFLSKTSEFLKRACNGDWKEGEAKKIEFPEQAPEVFEIYLQWLYTGDLVFLEEATPSKDAPGVEGYAARAFHSLVDLYCLADMLRDSHACNTVINKIIKMSKKILCGPLASEVSRVYAMTTKTSKLRLLFVDYYATYCDRDFYQNSSNALPHDFLTDVLGNMATRLRSGSNRLAAPGDVPKCTYHEHNDACPRCL
ncbi:btb poz domain containing [Lecanosticta acicola]|uniref:Btb poz domain containing n=1 Tax=Lecanosticta acicola TaxID=111012 RepID=A0AAI9EB14_9PEZI|nr:btb poz domain containing [Lecanosticta acicola]